MLIVSCAVFLCGVYEGEHTRLPNCVLDLGGVLKWKHWSA